MKNRLKQGVGYDLILIISTLLYYINLAYYLIL